MASVFLSYDHDDSGRAAPIAAALEANGHSVWWDRNIHGGAEYNSAIEAAVESSDAVVVLWSEKSVRSTWVRDEAGEGRDRGRLVPVLIDPVKPPLGFRQYQTIDLGEWSGGRRIPRLAELLHAIDRVSASPAPVAVTSTMSKAIRHSLPPISRRVAIGGGAAAAAAALAGGGIWWSMSQREDPRFTTLIDQARDALRKETADERTVLILERAVSMRPNNANALGLLALVNSQLAQNSNPKDTSRFVDQAEKSAERALSINPNEANALLAMFELQGSSLDWFTRDQKLRHIIAIAPDNVGAIAELVALTQATGMSRESWGWNERALALQPLSADFLGKRALKLWILGRTSEADKVIDQVRALYPNDEWGWFVRFRIYVFSGRPRAAQAMLDADPTMRGRPPLARLWRVSLPALEQPSAASIAKAREVCVESAPIAPPIASESLLIMSTLGDLDTAFDIANGYLLSRGPIVSREQPGSAGATQAAGWRLATQWMFTPPATMMRRDPRFLQLCNGIGLTDYWKKRGVKPDYQRT